MQKFHRRDVIDVDLRLEHHDEPLAVHLDAEDRGGENELADRALALGIDDLEFARRVDGLVLCCADERYERRAEEHLDDAGRALVS
jgi:hypothetical protein